MLTMIMLIVLLFFMMLSIFLGYKFFKIKQQHEVLDKRCTMLIHKLRTPLGTIQTGASGIKHYLPILITGYKQMGTQRSESVEISPTQLELLMEALANIELAVQNADKYLQELKSV